MKETNRKNKYSKYCTYIGEHEYQFEHVRPIFDKLGGRMAEIHGRHMVKGILIFMTQPTMEPNPAVFVRVYIGHGTSNKGLKMFWKSPGRYDYFMTTGPKMSAAFAMHNWGLVPGKNDIQVGPIKSDALVNGTFDRDKARKLMGAPDGKPIALFAPTWNRSTVQNYTNLLAPLALDYHVVLKPHPNEKVTIAEETPWIHLYTGCIDEILYAADLLLADESSTGYEFLPTGKPIVLLRNKLEGGFEDSPDYQIKNSTANWKPYMGEKGLLLEKVKEAEQRTGELQALCNRVFWPIDGHCAERACDWMVEQIERKWK